MAQKKTYRLLCLLAFFAISGSSYAQLNKITRGINQEKPKEYKQQQLRSERTGDKKMGLLTKFFQNTSSHYNYFFNGNNKIDEVIARARQSDQVDYTQLLPYYSYQLDNTAAQKTDLDSVIDKSSAGILLHDLRTNWVDNFYLLIGKAYYFSKEFDSAYMAFQFINYNLRPEDKKDDKHVKKAIGSNETKGSSVASPEDKDLITKVFTTPPSRNDALVWQIRTLTDMDMYGEASSLINLLQNDINFPERLKGELNDVTGYWFFKQGMYDSSAKYIRASLSTAIDKQDLARKEYLLAQLYEDKGSKDTADVYYAKAQKHATDPLLDIYASMKRVQLFAEGEPQAIKDGIARLLKMAKREKFYDYRQQIYYSTGHLALDLPDSLSALKYFYKSADVATKDMDLKTKTQLHIAQINYGLGNYRAAYAYYDSLSKAAPQSENSEEIIQKRDALKNIVKYLDIINREDSLQTIAALPAKEREKYLKKLSKQLRKELHLDDEDFDFDSNPFNRNDKSVDLFAQNSAKGKWYFYNNSMKAKGFSEFQRVWGKRNNIDNWRTKTTNLPATPNRTQRSLANPSPMDTSADSNVLLPDPDKELTIADITVDGLRGNLPLTDSLVKLSDEKIALAIFSLGKDYQNLLADYGKAIETYNKSLEKFPDKLYDGELPLNLSYCYKMIGNNNLAAKYANVVVSQYPNSIYADKLLNPDKHNPKVLDSIGTSTYDRIYRLFIKGDFAQAIAEKKLADEQYGDIHWTPQLLYIQSVYYIKKREDSTAFRLLADIINKYPNSSLKAKATTMTRVLQNRSKIEQYLTDLEIERMPEDSQIVVFDDTRISGNITGSRLERDDSRLLPPKQQVSVGKQLELREDKKVERTFVNKNFVLDIFSPQKVVMMLTDVDPVYISEARRGMERYVRSKFYSQKIEAATDTISEHQKVILLSDFINAEEAIKAMTQMKKDVRNELSWLPANSYSFYIISEDNLELLKDNKQLNDYLELLKKQYPDIFK